MIAGLQDDALQFIHCLYKTSHLFLICATIFRAKENIYLHLIIQEDVWALMNVQESIIPV